MTSTSEGSGGSSRKGVPVSPEHKEAIILGKQRSTIVRQYLDSLSGTGPSRTRKVNPETIKAKIAKIEEDLKGAGSLQRLSLIQKRINLEEQLEPAEQDDQIQELETRFIEIAAAYSESKNISTKAWREVGVPPNVLTKAGIR